MRVVRMLVALVSLGSTVLGLSVASAQEFSSPSGSTGAGIRLNAGQKGRVHAEMGFHTQSPAGATLTALHWTLGAAFRPTDAVEIELTVPIGGVATSTPFGGSDQFGVGNMALQGTFMGAPSPNVLLKGGFGLALAPWNNLGGSINSESLAVAIGATSTRSFQESWLALPQTVHLFFPFRVEAGREVRFTGDASIDMAIPTLDGLDFNAFIGLVPGVAWWAAETVNLGVRLPLYVNTVSNADNAQLSLEPYVRYDFDQTAFVSTRFTLNLDENLGFSFDSGRFWGWHMAFGANF